MRQTPYSEAANAVGHTHDLFPGHLPKRLSMPASADGPAAVALFADHVRLTFSSGGGEIVRIVALSDYDGLIVGVHSLDGAEQAVVEMRHKDTALSFPLMAAEKKDLRAFLDAWAAWGEVLGLPRYVEMAGGVLQRVPLQPTGLPMARPHPRRRNRHFHAGRPVLMPADHGRFVGREIIARR